MENIYLVSLEGGGDTQYTLVTQSVFKWIMSPYELKENGGYESLPLEVQNEMKKNGQNETKIYISISSFENDRALQAPGMTFNTLKEVFAYLKKNNLELADEYSGYIY